jgi:hypothetical protein
MPSATESEPAIVKATFTLLDYVYGVLKMQFFLGERKSD